MNLLRSLIYILQRESYDVKRFLSFVYRDWRWWSLEKRQALVWTSKVRLLYFCSWLLLALIIISFFYYGSLWTIVALLIILPLLPLLVLVSLFILWPVDYFLKRSVLARAKKKLSSLPVKIIGITGSYGKTSLKEILAVVLGADFKVIKTPENVNTDLGIANFILERAAEISAADYFIIEMGAYQIGDIAKICRLFRPEYSLLTGINEAHLERFGNLDNTIQAKFELGVATGKQVVLNLADENIKNNYQRFKLPGVLGVDFTTVQNIQILPDFKGLSFVYKGKNFSTPLLARHNIILIAMALALAEKLGLDLSQAVAPLATMPPIPHRLELIKNSASDVLVIDDSYNGNFQGFISGLEVLGRAIGRRLVITPGLVELGEKNEERHRAIADLYIEARLDQVLLINNSATRYIKEEFERRGFKNYIVYPDTPIAHNALASVLKPGDTIIFQNDWPDNYK